MQKYIKDAIYWNSQVGAWLRISDLNYIWNKTESYWTPACPAGRALVSIRDAFPYEDWMEEYIGTNKNLPDEYVIRKIKEGLKYMDDIMGAMPPSMHEDYKCYWLPWLDSLSERLNKLTN